MQVYPESTPGSERTRTGAGSEDLYLQHPVDVDQLQQQRPASKRPSVVFLDVPTQINEVVELPTSEKVAPEGFNGSLGRRSTVGSIKSFLSTSSSVMPVGYTYYHVVVFILTYVR